MKKKAFTLIELIIVLAILALLIAIAVPKYNQSQKKAAITAHEANVSALYNAAELYFFEKHEATTWTGTENETWVEYLSRYPSVPKQLDSATPNYQVTVDAKGVITITPGAGTYKMP